MTKEEVQSKSGLFCGAQYGRLLTYKPEWWNGRRSGLKIRGPVIGRTGSSPVSGTISMENADA